MSVYSDFLSEGYFSSAPLSYHYVSAIAFGASTVDHATGIGSMVLASPREHGTGCVFLLVYVVSILDVWFHVKCSVSSVRLF